MRVFCSLVLSLAFLLLGLPSSVALETGDIDIVGLRLGMSEADAMTRLRTQAVRAGAIQVEQEQCSGKADADCGTRLSAPTHDGQLVLRLAGGAAGDQRVWSIAYTLAGRMPGETEAIRNAVLERYGRPVREDPLAWCGRSASAAHCPADQPRLTYSVGPEPRAR